MIFILSNQPRIGVSEDYIINFIFFKTLHVLVYACLFLLLSRGFYFSSQRIDKNTKTKAALIAIMYAISDEGHQSFIPTREGTARDVLIDGIGIAGAYWCISYYKNLTIKAISQITIKKYRIECGNVYIMSVWKKFAL